MTKKYNFLVLLIFAVLTARAQSGQMARKSVSFDKNWSFLQGDAPGADQKTYNDTKWQKVNLPHDWSILGNFSQNNPAGRGGGYLPSGIGWYRKHFELESSDAGKNIAVEFDGIMANSDVWINGHHLGYRPYGYSALNYDLTGYLNFGKGKTNTISVRADNTIQPASRFYTGAGIYRHVRLVVSNDLHIAPWGIFITTPIVGASKATVHIKNTLINNAKTEKTFSLQTAIFDTSGHLISQSPQGQPSKISTGKSLDIDNDLIINNPSLWDINNPYLYKAVTQVIADGKVVDDEVTNFGVRGIKFDADSGFLLNGKKVMIKGVCLHQDGGAVGAAVPERVWQRRLELLKDIGVNGIRTAHHPFTTEFLELCDRMGFLVMDESLDTWEAKKQHAENGYGLFFKEWWEKDTRDMVMRDRNHPSIVIYSVGNEIHDNLNDSTGFKKYRDMQNLVHQYDGTRPVTMALFRPGISKVYVNGFAKMMDVVGQNYRENELIAAHQANPTWKVVGTENGLSQSAWLALRDHPFIAGQFLWVGIDYLGEADWPDVVNGQGLFDRTGGIRPVGLQRESWWSEKPVVHIVRKQENGGVGPVVADWTPTDFDTYDDARVSVYSNCDDVELFLNGKSLGTKTKPMDDSPRDWNVTYEKGTIKAVGKNKGIEVATEELKTAAEPAKIQLTVDRPSLTDTWEDVAYVTATIVDDKGVPCPLADKLVTFSISGPGVIAATDNGSVANQESFTVPVRHSYQGKCIAIIKGSSAGKIIVKAASTGLADGAVTINVVNK